MPVKLIIFDLDGTLVDTAGDITDALNRAIKPLGLGPVSVDETKALIGEGSTRLIEKALSPLGAKAGERAVSAASKRFLDGYAKHLTHHSTLYAGVKETLWKLSAFDKAVLSNKREALSKKLLQDLGIYGAFALIAGSDTTSARKPSPEAVRHVLKAIGAKPREAVMVGDSPYDIEAARGAGVMSVAVTYGYRDRSLLTDADHMIDSLDELVPLMLRIRAIAEKRREDRHPVAYACRKYISISVRSGQGFFPAVLLDLSRNGLMFRGPVRFTSGTPFECEISIPKVLSRTIGIRGTVRHSTAFESEYRTGVQIEKVSSEMWFRVFKKVSKFISEREGTVY